MIGFTLVTTALAHSTLIAPMINLNICINYLLYADMFGKEGGKGRPLSENVGKKFIYFYNAVKPLILIGSCMRLLRLILITAQMPHFPTP